jgi:hypothetical protein
LAKAFQIFRGGVLRPVNYPEILGPSAFHSWLDQPARPSRDEFERLHHHSFTTSTRHLFPPSNTRFLTGRIGYVNDHVRCREQQPFVRITKSLERRHMPHMIFVSVDFSFRRQQMKRR